MNLQCPNCQKLLQVPEQYAGQLMKCPLCGGTFTLPALAPPAPEPIAPPPPVSVTPPPAPPPPAPAPDAFTGLGTPAPAASAAAPAPPLSPTDSPAPSLPPPAGYTRSYTFWFSPQVLQYVAPVSVVLIFFLQFFNWVGIYPGGVPAVTQGAWGTAFGHYSVDPDLDTGARFGKEDKEQPGANVLMIFYVLLFLVNLVLTVGVLALTFVPVKLPPQVQQFWPWRWCIVAAANAVVFLFLALQLIVGFSLENVYTQRLEEQIKPRANPTTKEQKETEVARGMALSNLHRTLWLRLVVVLHLLAIAASSLVYCLHQRGSRPLPKVELVW